MHVMQSIDSISNNLFYPKVQLMTGSSGGMLGLAYYRELKWQESQKTITDANDRAFRSNVAGDLLNPIIFTLVINDFFFIRTKFAYMDRYYVKERGYAFERQLNAHTGGVFEKPIAAYLQPELDAEIPMLILSPSVINDGRKLYISPQSITFMSDFHEGRMSAGMDFQSLFPNHQAGQLRFSTALRMNATFPIISPNVILPSEPKMEIMDSGLSDNFGMVDALEYLQNFQEWIEANTSGVILLSIRDTERVAEVSKQFQRSLLQKITVPFSVLANNWSTQQDFRNEEIFKLVRGQFKVPVERVEFQYFKYDEVLLQALESEEYLARQMARASLSWHLTPKEKQSIYSNFFNDPRNRTELRRLQRLLEGPQVNRSRSDEKN
jgi:hypothetical protein